MHYHKIFLSKKLWPLFFFSPQVTGPQPSWQIPSETNYCWRSVVPWPPPSVNPQLALCKPRMWLLPWEVSMRLCLPVGVPGGLQESVGNRAWLDLAADPSYIITKKLLSDIRLQNLRLNKE